MHAWKAITSTVAISLCSTAWANTVTLRGSSPQGGEVAVTLARADALAMKATATKLARAGCDTYLNLWAKRSTRGRSYPSGSGALLVCNVKNRGSWVSEYAKETIGFVCNGSPLVPGYSGYLRIGDDLFTYNAIRAGEWHDHTYATRPEKISDYTHEHVESTFEATPQEIAAMKAFYFARANAAVLDPRTGRVHLPEWRNPGNSNFKHEGCAGASTSALNHDWLGAFRYSIDNIRRVGEQLGIREMATATPEMVDTIRSFIDRTGLKQNTTPKALVREFALGSPASQRITILNAPADEIPQNFIRDFYWDQRYSNADGDNGWNGLGKYPMLPDLNQGARSSAFRNVRLHAISALDDVLR